MSLSPIYGVFVVTHHSWSKILVLIAPEEGQERLAALNSDDDVTIERRPDRLPRALQKRTGGYQAFIDRHQIDVLDSKAWAVLKERLTAGSE